MFVLPLSRPASLLRRSPVAPAFGTALDRLFDESFDRYVGGSATGADSRTPAMDVSESDAAYTIVFEVPGTTREQLKVSVEGKRVVLSTVVASEAAAPVEGQVAPVAEARPAARVLYRERSVAAYARTVVLPAEVDQAQSQARFENGVLTLTLAKKVPAGATQLSIA
ncbi:MAG: Hsp20/alpha crystallin family protein [Burkholderiales bacterium]|nr:Hsp20/alpha crystallin family protein [Burkholderiales bacterium]